MVVYGKHALEGTCGGMFVYDKHPLMCINSGGMVVYDNHASVCTCGCMVVHGKHPLVCTFGGDCICHALVCTSGGMQRFLWDCETCSLVCLQYITPQVVEKLES